MPRAERRRHSSETDRDSRAGVRLDHPIRERSREQVFRLPVLRHRKSSFLDGIGADTIDLTVHLRANLDRNVAAA